MGGGKIKLPQKLLYNFFATTMTCQSVSGEEKIMSLCVSDI